MQGNQLAARNAIVHAWRRLTLHEIRQPSRRLHPLLQIPMLQPLDLHLHVISPRGQVLFGPFGILPDVDLDSMVETTFVASQGARPATRAVRTWIEDQVMAARNAASPAGVPAAGTSSVPLALGRS